ncbi:hypothetical protein GZ77_02180 [Endozoicomonas montiporae]|uniref:Semialdehyde dehydrogenase dimerisation domain-containing protein n=2 Tax=Endozoicomonas montiporae TaxID=1027273 RepID=A0A081NAJ7_9GAMM|nr:Asd/ArgC dimerization domain-containing protein [Endozoicomonas montiporae]AMO56855.1 aspartate-semialdehyde dehydrogenase [Endozoicomonas montiporae CL-33]KEQ15470.1 hypothetical protein GZ77_02180 [Endozoicomonas montiporae]
MNKLFDVVVYDAQSLNGEALLALLDERVFPVGNLYAIAQDPESDAAVSFQDQEVELLKAEGFEFIDADLLILPVGCKASDELVGRATEAGCFVMDGRSGSQAGPLMMSGINDDQIEAAREAKVAVVPSSPAALMLPVLKPLEEALGIDSVSVTVCQSVSGLGNDGINDLRKQTIELLNGKPVSGGRMAFNLLPQVGELNSNGSTSVEQSMISELIEGLGSSDVRINPTCVRVPVFFGDSLSIQLELDKPAEADTVRELLADIQGVELTAGDDFPTVETVAGNDTIVVGRIRQQARFAGQLALWLVADPVRRAAMSTIDMAEILLKDFLK